MSEIQKPVFFIHIMKIFYPFNRRKPLSIPAAEKPLSIPTAATLASTAASLPRFHLHPHQQDSWKIRFAIIGYMKKTPNYILTEIYYDFGISGYKDPPWFAKCWKMPEELFSADCYEIHHCFAHNTDTVLKTTRQLKDWVDIF